MSEHQTFSRGDMEALITEAKSGNEHALSKIYIDYYTPLYRYIYSRVTHKGMAEDLTQTVFLKIYQALPTMDETRSHPIAYFYTVARNTLIDHYRKKSHEPIFDDEALSVSDETMGSDKDTEIREAKDLVEKGLAMLNDEQREIVSLRFMSDMSTKEIADVIKKSDDAVRQILSRSIKILREHFIDTR